MHSICALARYKTLSSFFSLSAPQRQHVVHWLTGPSSSYSFQFFPFVGAPHNREMDKSVFFVRSLFGCLLLVILFIIEKSSNKNHIFSHTFGYYCRIYFDKQLICMSNKLWRLHEFNHKWQTKCTSYKYQMYKFTQEKILFGSVLSSSLSVGFL